ncbi:hypothetical protein LSAT2_010602 [Lamellibrachia satsuma]|nr:hypothetical protein LSAT2_010602 [Lamellibrachia satsuma]
MGLAPNGCVVFLLTWQKEVSQRTNFDNTTISDVSPTNLEERWKPTSEASPFEFRSMQGTGKSTDTYNHEQSVRAFNSHLRTRNAARTTETKCSGTTISTAVVEHLFTRPRQRQFRWTSLKTSHHRLRLRTLKQVQAENFGAEMLDSMLTVHHDEYTDIQINVCKFQQVHGRPDTPRQCLEDCVKPKKEETVVHILDSHKTYTKNLAATDMARKAGIWSFTIYVFQDSDFAAATVTNVITDAAQVHNPTPHLTPADAAPALIAVAMEAVPELCPLKKETS